MRRAVILAHYDADGEVKPYVRYYLKALAEHAERVCFASTAPGVDPSGLEGVTEPPLLLENRGFDFAMWKTAMQRLDLSNVDELVLTNSSVFGPVGDLGAAFAAMSDREADFWAITESFELTWHLQSYFLVLRRPAFESTAFARFFESVLPYREKNNVIFAYELGLSQWLKEAGLRPAALLPAPELWSKTPGAMVEPPLANPTKHLPRRLLERGCPFVKVEALRDNPGEADLRQLRRRMKKGGYPMALVHVG